MIRSLVLMALCVCRPWSLLVLFCLIELVKATAKSAFPCKKIFCIKIVTLGIFFCHCLYVSRALHPPSPPPASPLPSSNQGQTRDEGMYASSSRLSTSTDEAVDAEVWGWGTALLFFREAYQPRRYVHICFCCKSIKMLYTLCCSILSSCQYNPPAPSCNASCGSS
jgi:hypothetical protein